MVDSVFSSGRKIHEDLMIGNVSEASPAVRSVINISKLAQMRKRAHTQIETSQEKKS
jgi:hypothetical protein